MNPWDEDRALYYGGGVFWVALFLGRPLLGLAIVAVCWGLPGIWRAIRRPYLS